MMVGLTGCCVLGGEMGNVDSNDGRMCKDVEFYVEFCGTNVLCLQDSQGCSAPHGESASWRFIMAQCSGLQHLHRLPENWESTNSGHPRLL